MNHRSAKRSVKFISILLLSISLGACERNQQEQALAETPDQEVTEQQEQSPGDDGEAHDHDHDQDDVHLSAVMSEIGERFAALWFAAEAENSAMFNYQTHELEEIIEELEEKGIQEEGIDVFERLNSDIASRFESMEDAVAAGDFDAFEATYQTVVTSCNSCHAATAHNFINVKTPDYNPYPGLDFSPRP